MTKSPMTVISPFVLGIQISPGIYQDLEAVYLLFLCCPHQGRLAFLAVCLRGRGTPTSNGLQPNGDGLHY